MDYKERLRRKASKYTRGEKEEAAPPAKSDFATLVQQLAEDDEAQRVVFQSVAVTALQFLHRVRSRIEVAAEAALSLGQRERLQKMNSALTDTVEALQAGLSAQGEQMLDLCGDDEEASLPEDGQSWWFALTEAIELLEESAQQMSSLAAGQPDDSTARQLGECVANLFQQQHSELLFEADQWIS